MIKPSGKLNLALVAAPFKYPDEPVPAIVEIFPDAPETIRMTRPLCSKMYRLSY